jgi:hypothetical protein
MNQERFDGLARGLATNRLSRAQVLKSVAAGLLLSCIGTLSPRHTRFAAAQPAQQPSAPAWCESVPKKAPPRPIKPTYRKDNVVEGDCKAFLRGAKTGVRGRDGNPNKNHLGITRCYTTHTKLPTFKTNKPRPGAEVVCLTTTWVGPVTFKAHPEIYLLNWRRKKEALSSTCKAYESKLESELEKHEKVHANQCHPIAAKAGPAWHEKYKNHEFIGCGHNPVKARESIEAKIEDSLVEFANTEIDPCEEEIGNKFHSTLRVTTICCEGPGGCGCPSGKECCQTGSDPTGPVFGCVNLKTDPKHCGKCGNACPDGQTCKQGKCVNTKCGGSGGVKCSPGQVCCKGQCVNTSSDPSNCGSCGKACKSGQTCNQGKCANKPGGTTRGCQSSSDCARGGVCCITPGGSRRYGVCCTNSEVCDYTIPRCTDCAGASPSVGISDTPKSCYADNGDIYCIVPAYTCCPGADKNHSGACGGPGGLSDNCCVDSSGYTYCC